MYAIKVSLINAQGDEEDTIITPIKPDDFFQSYEAAKQSIKKVISRHVIESMTKPKED